MENLGNWLRAARQAKALSLQDVETATCIRARYLEALEAGDYGAMPAGEAQARGFLRRYATFLGLSAEEAIQRYEQSRQTQQAVAPAAQAVPPPAAPPRPVDLAHAHRRRLQLVVALCAVLVLLIAGTWLAGRLDLRASRQPAPGAETAASVSSALPETWRGATLLPPVTALPQPTPTFVVLAEGGVTLSLQAEEHVWVRVIADGFIAYEGMLAPGAAPLWMANETVVVETGNGAAVTAIVNGQSQGRLGERGQVSVCGWGPQGEIEVELSSGR